MFNYAFICMKVSVIPEEGIKMFAVTVEKHHHHNKPAIEF